MGILLWWITFGRWGLYKVPPHTPIVEEIRKVLSYSFFWFLSYIGIVYLTTGFLTNREIPRLIIIYAYIFVTFGSILLRYGINLWYTRQYKNKKNKESLLVIGEKGEQYAFSEQDEYTYIYKDTYALKDIESLIREKKVSKVIYTGEYSKMKNIFELARIYGIAFLYPKITKYTPIQSSKESWVAGIPMIELSPIAITPWQRIIKRVFDIIISTIALIILMPVWIIIWIWIWISDWSGPIIYQNRRIGQDGKIFALYKFRYMYWKYSTKEAYNIDDGSLRYEEKLKKEKNTREWPLYKISDDPRVMPWWRLIERFSLDELPQLYNVLRWDMSLIWPRPHQPREIALYDESDRQVLTIKPGITGMAQVYGRDKNSFKDEVALDTYYIENYSLSLDIAIFLRTFLVVVTRVFWK